MAIEKLDFKKVTKEKTPYTVLLNSVIQNISNLEALAVWVYLYSLPQDWSVNKEHLKNQFTIGDDKLKAIFSYLQRANLVSYSQERHKNGLLGEFVICVLCGDKFKVDEPFKKTGGVKSTPVVATGGGLTTRAVNHTCGSRGLQKKEKNKASKSTKKTPWVSPIEKRKAENEPKQIAQFWEPGNPDYDRIHGKERRNHEYPRIRSTEKLLNAHRS